MYELPKIDVHGKKSEDASRIIRTNLLSFYNRGYDQVFIVHGHGTGTLKSLTRTILRSCPYAKSFRSGRVGEGGDGVTVVTLR